MLSLVAFTASMAYDSSPPPLDVGLGNGNALNNPCLDTAQPFHAMPWCNYSLDIDARVRSHRRHFCLVAPLPRSKWCLAWPAPCCCAVVVGLLYLSVVPLSPSCAPAPSLFLRCLFFFSPSLQWCLACVLFFSRCDLCFFLSFGTLPPAPPCATLPPPFDLLSSAPAPVIC